jgi:hypothetical protein
MSGGDLLSQGTAPQVPSALAGFTSVFGMGTGGSLPLEPPDKASSLGQPEDSIASTSSCRKILYPSPRPISTGPLNTLTVLTRPAYQPGLLPGALTLLRVGSLISRWASHLDAFSAYPVRT